MNTVEQPYGDERTVRARLRTLTDDEKAGIDRRLQEQ